MFFGLTKGPTTIDPHLFLAISRTAFDVANTLSPEKKLDLCHLPVSGEGSERHESIFSVSLGSLFLRSPPRPPPFSSLNLMPAFHRRLDASWLDGGLWHAHRRWANY